MTTVLFKNRLSTFYFSWRTHKDLWGNSDVIVISTPPQASNLRSSQVFLWLFFEDLADTTAIFTPSSIFFLCTQKSFSRLRSLGGYATEVMQIPVSVDLKPRNDEGLSKLDGIIRSMRLSLYSGKSLFAADLNWPLTVGCIDNEMPKSKLLLNCVNGFENYAKYRIASVNSGVEKLIFQGDKDNVLADDIQYNRGVKRTMEDRMDALDKAKAPLLESLRKLEKPNQSVLFKDYEEKNIRLCEGETSSKANNNEKMILKNLGKFERADKPSLVVDQRENTQPIREGETRTESFKLEKAFGKESKDMDNCDVKEQFLGMKDVGMHCYNEGNLLSLEEPREFKQQYVDQRKTEKGALIMKKEEAQKWFMVLEQKLTFFYSSWRRYRKELWGDSDVLVITTQPSGSLATLHHSISSSFLLWLLGRDFPKTTAVFMDQSIDFICPNESFPTLCSLGPNITKAAQVSVSIQLKVKANDELELIDATLYALRTRQASHHPVIIGYIGGEFPNSKVLDCCVAKLDERRFQAMDVISGFIKVLNEGGGLESLQRQGSNTVSGEEIKNCIPEDSDIETLAENYQQIMSLMNCNNAKTASIVSNELEKDGLLQEKYENNNVLHKSEETKQLLEEVNGNLPSKFAQMNILVKEEQCNHLTPAIEDGIESKLVAEEGNSRNAEQVVLAEEKEQDYHSSNVRDDGIENPCNQSKESVVSDDDDWEIIERHREGQEPDIAKDSGWRSWIGKAFSSVSLHNKAAGDEAS